MVHQEQHLGVYDIRQQDYSGAKPAVEIVNLMVVWRDQAAEERDELRQLHHTRQHWFSPQ